MLLCTKVKPKRSERGVPEGPGRIWRGPAKILKINDLLDCLQLERESGATTCCIAQTWVTHPSEPDRHLGEAAKAVASPRLRPATELCSNWPSRWSHALSVNQVVDCSPLLEASERMAA